LSISECRDVEFFENMFPLKKNVSVVVYKTISVHDNVNMPSSSSISGDSVDKLRRSKRHRVETSLVLTFLPPF